jgi:hypothetical protein
MKTGTLFFSRAVAALLLACLASTFTISARASAVIRVPYIDVISPIGVVPGAATFTLRVRGAGFYPGARVHWRAGTTTTILDTTVTSGTFLQAFVPADLVAFAGTATITVVNPAPIPASNPMYFPIHHPFTGPTSSADITVGAFSELQNRPIGIADFNGDGILDMAVGNACGNSVSILFGNGDGTFTAGPTLSVGLQPTGIAVADFNHDGNADLAVEDFGDATVYVFLGDGTGGFTLSQVIPALGCCPLWITTADLFDHGKLDLALSFKTFTGGFLTILSGNGDGTFATSGLTIDLPPGSQPTAIAIGDFNGDNKLDLAVTDVILNEVHILLGTGTTFTFGEVVPTEDNPAPVALGDYNGDGILDMAVANLYENSVSMFQGNGDGTFTEVNTFDVDDGPYPIEAGNFDGNEKMDLIVGNHFGNNARIWHGNGDFTFTAGAIAHAGDGPTFVNIGDFNNDGTLDYVMGSEYDDTVSVGLVAP